MIVFRWYIKSLMNNDILKQIEVSKNTIHDVNDQIEKMKSLLEENDQEAIHFFVKYYDILFRIEHSKNKEKRRFIKSKNEMEYNKQMMEKRIFMMDICISSKAI